MSVSNRWWKKVTQSGRATILVSALILFVAAFGLFGFARSADAANPNAQRCYGTYLMLEDSGVQSLWSFDARGTLQTTSSAEDFVDAFNTGFSHAQGVYKRAKGVVKTTTLDFSLDGTTEPTSIARVDGELVFSNSCQDVTGSFDLRFYNPGNDPLDIDDHALILTGFTVTGRLITTE